MSMTPENQAEAPNAIGWLIDNNLNHLVLNGIGQKPYLYVSDIMDKYADEVATHREQQAVKVALDTVAEELRGVVTCSYITDLAPAILTLLKEK